MKNFIIAGVQRSGTTLITTSLNNHPDVRCDGELFKTRRPRGDVDLRDSGYRAYLDTSWRLRIEDQLWRRRVVCNFLDRYFGALGWQAIGFKLMRNQMSARRFPMLAKYLIDRQVSVIHVIRDNLLKVYLSRLGARRRQNFHATCALTEPALHVPVTDLESQLSTIESQISELITIFQRTVPYLAITYERYVADPVAEGQRMLDFLGVPGASLHSPLVKLNPDDLSQLVANLYEVRQCLGNTRFAKYTVAYSGAG